MCSSLVLVRNLKTSLVMTSGIYYIHPPLPSPGAELCSCHLWSAKLWYGVQCGFPGSNTLVIWLASPVCWAWLRETALEWRPIPDDDALSVYRPVPAERHDQLHRHKWGTTTSCDDRYIWRGEGSKWLHITPCEVKGFNLVSICGG